MNREDKIYFMVFLLFILLGGTLKSVSSYNSRPYNGQYNKLEAFLSTYIELTNSGGWNMIAQQKKSLVPGDRDSLVLQLRGRLIKEKYLRTTTKNTSPYFDRELEQALSQFQKDNGLPQTGNLDKRTIQILNITPQQRVDLISLNMERWERYDFDTVKAYILVNIPDLTMRYISEGKEVLTRKVIRWV